MKITENNIKIDKTARYYTNASGNKKINEVWLVIHGYAQLAKDFIKEFEFLSDPGTLIAAPEGLSKFYSKNIPAASWMTKEDRTNEICDYINYLDSVFNELNNFFDLTTAKISLLGFSQGVHTAARWFIESRYHFHKLILCSSDFPKDADFERLKEKLKRSELFYVCGKYDSVISLKKFKENLELLRLKGIDYKDLCFDGSHEINEAAILEVHSSINKKNHS